jgi:hypothetical protein
VFVNLGPHFPKWYSLSHFVNEARGSGRETRMRSERASLLDRRERRANDESSLFSSLGKTGAVSMPLPRAIY